jgi:dienelactone hydrolase
MNLVRYAAAAALMAGFAASSALGQEPTPPPKPKLKDELRMPWQRGDGNFLRQWLVAGPFACGLQADCLSGQGGESAAQASDGPELKRADGTSVRWHAQKAWSDDVTFGDLPGAGAGDVAYAFAKVSREKAGPAVLSIGSRDGIRVWLNGKPVLARDGLRSATPDEDRVAVEMNAGENVLLVKAAAESTFYARVLEPGATLTRRAEIGPSLVELHADGFTLVTDVGPERKEADPVTVEVVRAGGQAAFTTTAARGAKLAVDAHAWPDGAYEVRCSSPRPTGLLYATHLPWYKGDSLAEARELAATAAAADATKPEGLTLRMLVDMVEDRLGGKLTAASGNPWQKIHAPLMEYEELMLERQGQTGRIRPYGFVRLAYRDDVDGSPQFCRAYLPPGYEPGRKWPLVMQLHGYNPANPVYVRWWGASERHPGIDTEFSSHQGVIYLEAHGRGNTQYLGMGDSDVVHAIAEAKRLFSVDEDRVYLTGDSMGGWGTWNVATRHPDLFAAIAPVFGGVDYHSTMSEEDLARLLPVERFSNEKQSSWAMADGLLNVPIFVHHGDADQAVNVEYSRWAVRLLQRWGYDVRYHEYPGRVHEALQSQNANMSIEWFLQHRRDAAPRKVRLRSAELRHATAHWVSVLQATSPLAFMVVDAEVVDRNVIRLDTDNVLDVELAPSAALVDPQRPVTVVWNGEPRELRLENDHLRLTAAGYAPAALHKNARLPGSTADFTATPFAVVIGTSSKDKEMVALCRQKAKTFVDGWRDWQKQEPRVFQDTELQDADMARYSLMLVGGPDANRVTAKLAARLPLQLAKESVTIDGKTFAAKDAAVQLLYPNPLNPERYVFVVAATSTDGMYFSGATATNLPEWDYVVTDGRIPAFGQKASALQSRVVSGTFDSNWRFSDALSFSGDGEIRSKGRLRHRPSASLAVDPALQKSYAGHYQIEKGPLLEVFLDGKRLMVRQQGQPDSDELLPESATEFSVPKYDVWISFVRDASGKVTELVGYQGGDFTAKKVD